MVEKISVNIRVISLNIEQNFLVPSDMDVGQATILIMAALFDEYGIKRDWSTPMSLMKASTCAFLDPTCTFAEMGIIQGEKLILIGR